MTTPQPADGCSSNEDGWIEWSGGANPVGHHDVVEAKRLDGSVVTKAAFKFDWRRGPIAHGSDIIAYRIAGSAHKGEGSLPEIPEN